MGQRRSFQENLILCGGSHIGKEPNGDTQGISGPDHVGFPVFDKSIAQKKYLTVGDLAELLSVSQASVRRWILQRKIEPLRIGPGKLIRFDNDYIKGWISQNNEEI